MVKSQNKIFGLVWNITSPTSHDVTSKDVVFSMVGVFSPEFFVVEKKQCICADAHARFSRISLKILKIYIENQFFIYSTYYMYKLKNTLPMTLRVPVFRLGSVTEGNTAF